MVPTGHPFRDDFDQSRIDSGRVDSPCLHLKLIAEDGNQVVFGNMAEANQNLPDLLVGIFLLLQRLGDLGKGVSRFSSSISPSFRR